MTLIFLCFVLEDTIIFHDERPIPTLNTNGQYQHQYQHQYLDKVKDDDDKDERRRRRRLPWDDPKKMQSLTRRLTQLFSGKRTQDTAINGKNGHRTSFEGSVPWDFNTLASLEVPRTADGQLDVDAGASLFLFAGLCYLPAAIDPGTVLACKAGAMARKDELCSRLRDLRLDPDSVTHPFRFREGCQRGPGRYDLRFKMNEAPFDTVTGHRSAWIPLGSA
jgi:hypothetical protein